MFQVVPSRHAGCEAKPLTSRLACLRGWLAAVALLASCAMFALSPANAAESKPACPPFLYAAEGAGKILEYDRHGKVVWDYPAEMSRDVWSLPNGNILFCYIREYDSKRQDNPSGVLEVTRDKRVVWQFSTTGQVWSCQRLADGTTLVGAASQGKLLIVGRDATVVKEIKLLNRPGHSCLRNARQLPNGNFLVAEESAQAAREYNPDGKLVREIKVNFRPYSAVRLDNGHTVICGQKTVVEVDPADHVVWSLDGAEIPAMGIRWFAGIQVLPAGNIFICNAGGRVPFLEITKAKRILWHCGAGEYPMGHGVQRLDVLGRPCK